MRRAPSIVLKILEFKAETCNCNSIGPAVADKFFQSKILQFLFYFINFNVGKKIFMYRYGNFMFFDTQRKGGRLLPGIIFSSGRLPGELTFQEILDLFDFFVVDYFF